MQKTNLKKPKIYNKKIKLKKTTYLKNTKKKLK